MKDRERACIYYLSEGECAKGRAGTFWSACQTCKKYQARTFGKPARKDLRRSKNEDFNRREMKDVLKNY